MSITRTGSSVYVTLGGSKLGFVRDFFIVWWARLIGARMVGHYHGGGYDQLYRSWGPIGRLLVRSTLRRVDAIVVLGERLKEQFSFVGNSTAKRIAVVPNGLPADTDVRDRVKKLPRSGQSVSILYLSNMIRSKGYLALLDAIAILAAAEEYFVECHFCGEFLSFGTEEDAQCPSEQRAAFERAVSRLDVADRVTYHGTVKGADKQRLLNDCHVFVLPTFYPGEGQPISIIEALAYGMPVIATRYRGIPELVEHGETGLLLETASPRAIADSIDWVLSDDVRYQALSERASQSVKLRFSQERYIENLVHLLA